MITKLVKVSSLKNNTGQVVGLPKNPRFIKDEKYFKLKKSIEDDPEMLELREIIVYDNDGELIVICGNMRLRVLRELNVKETYVKILPRETDVEKLKAYTIKDNIGFGEHDFDLLANEWDQDKLIEWGLDLTVFEIEDEKDLSKNIKTYFKIEINCNTEKEQEVLYNELINRGIECRLLTL